MKSHYKLNKEKYMIGMLKLLSRDCTSKEGLDMLMKDKIKHRRFGRILFGFGIEYIQLKCRPNSLGRIACKYSLLSLRMFQSGMSLNIFHLLEKYYYHILSKK
jgi:hypothetical protein